MGPGTLSAVTGKVQLAAPVAMLGSVDVTMLAGQTICKSVKLYVHRWVENANIEHHLQRKTKKPISCICTPRGDQILTLGGSVSRTTTIKAHTTLLL